MSFEKEPRQPVPPPSSEPHGNSPGQPTYGQPTYGPPTHGQPTYGPPTHGQPTYEQPPHGQQFHEQQSYDPSYGQQQFGPYAGGQVSAQSDDRTWATISHVGSFLAAWVALGLLCPLIVLLVRPNRRFVRHHAYESLNFQLNALVIAVVGGFLGVVIGILTLGLGLLVIIPITLAYVGWYCALVIMASAAANRGELYRYPAIVRVFNA